MAKKSYRPIKVGDTHGLLRSQLLFEGQPIVLPGGTTVVCRWKDRDDSSLVIVDDEAGVVDDATNGIVGYQRKTSEVANALTALVEFTVTFPSTEVHVSPDITLPIIAAQ